MRPDSRVPVSGETRDTRASAAAAATEAKLAAMVRGEPREVAEVRSLMGFVDGTEVDDPFSFRAAQHEAAHAVAAIVLSIRFDAVVVGDPASARRRGVHLRH